MTNDVLSVAVIQTSLDGESAWAHDGVQPWQDSVRMATHEERRAKIEIRRYLALLRGMDQQADFVLFPELSVPMGFLTPLKMAAESLESIIVAGLDYRIELSKPHPAVSNSAVIIVPKVFRGKKILARTEVRWVGKTFPAPGERNRLLAIGGSGVEFVGDPTVTMFEDTQLGNFAVVICYDFMDLDRIVMYRSNVQTLFVLAYNRDTTSFDHLSEALGRMLFCNVVVCNCGKFGGSHAVSPFRTPHKRTVYRHSGSNLPNLQLIRLPLASLVSQQNDGLDREFKSLPPGFPGTSRSKL